MSKGFTVGKFMPLHKGHELMLKLGSRLIYDFHVIVSGKETDKIPLSKRVDWVMDFCRGAGLTNTTVHYHEDNSPPSINIDSMGTVLDPEFQQYWIDEFNRLVPGATHMITSDYYGEVLVKQMGIQWIPADPLRETINISGTVIRKDPETYFNLISEPAKRYFAKKIAIVGPESVGKSTLSKILAEHFQGSSVPEYGRAISEAKKNILDFDDFMHIANGQNVILQHAIEISESPFIFSDTELFVTYQYAKEFLGIKSKILKTMAVAQDFDLYLVMAPTTSWVDDGTRIMSDQKKREQFTESLIQMLGDYKKTFVAIEDRDFETRTKTAIESVTQRFSD